MSVLGMRVHRRTAAAIAVLICGVPLVACSSSQNGTNGTTGAPNTSIPSLTVAIANPAMDHAPIYVAEAAKLFQKYGVNVTVEHQTGSNTLTLLSSKKVDLTDLPPPTAMIATSKGFPMSIIYEVTTNTALAMIAPRGVTSLAQLKNKSNCRIGTAEEGTVVYAATQLIKARYGLNCTVVQAASIPAVLAAVAAGSYQAGVVTYSAALTATGTNILINPTQYNQEFVQATQAPLVVFFGLKDVLNAKRAGIVRFLRAITAAQQIIQTDPLSKVVALIQQDPDYKTVSLATMEKSLQPNLPYIGKSSPPGFISTTDWQNALQSYTNWGVPGYSPSDTAYSYSNLIDMSFDNASNQGS
jgi:ABC-type nitrate/sulfonate/bicarbonate transport system substrate-binding protein